MLDIYSVVVPVNFHPQSSRCMDVDIFVLQDIVDLAGDWGVVDMHPSVATVVF